MQDLPTRRDFLRRSGQLALSLGAAMHLPHALAQADAYPHSSGSQRAASRLPDDACDCHMHIYDPRFAWAPGAKLVHAPATVAMYRQLQQRLGTTRNVVVTPSAYGVDNSCTLDALAQLGRSARGVAVVNDQVSDAELQRLHQAGVRGLRFNLAVGSVTTVEMMEPLARRVAPLGWHLQANMPNEVLLAHRAMLARLPVPLVFDHFARIPLQADATHPVFDFVTGLMRERRASVKLSGAYLYSKRGAPDYDDVAPLARALVQLAPTQLVWGSDWPHPTEQHKPDDARLLDVMISWLGSEEMVRTVLVANPARLYQF
ncbi:amidohydrolase family protein [Herbaspirillum seropedicae]|uniref:amidohydrolase family protein n=1 Tax=Herbaspirillum seropedicae TaxID=964 RepID=UPI000847E3F8|nr:amidohydrolase family protein [Herbaspirillum seropedicae]AON56836.1 amidohydrolase 2 [Herbaspirillum seropedicae]